MKRDIVYLYYIRKLTPCRFVSGSIFGPADDGLNKIPNAGSSSKRGILTQTTGYWFF